MIIPNNRAFQLKNAIRDVAVIASNYEKKTGNKVLKLNIGDPLRYDFKTPEHMKRALSNAVMNDYNYYSESQGLLELREYIAHYENKKNKLGLTSDDILVTTGVSEAMNFTFASLLQQGDNVLVPGPTYPPYNAIIKFYGAEPISYELIEDESWRPNIDDLREKVDERTRAIVIINPNNPTGALFKKKEIKEIMDVAAEHNIPIISDEIYDLMVYDKEEFVSPTRIDNQEVPIIVFNGFSKVFFATGWRLGYVYLKDDNNQLSDVWKSMNNLSKIRLCVTTPIQKAAVSALKEPKDYFNNYMKMLKERRDFIYKRVSEIDGLEAQKPKGAFYTFPKITSSKYKSDYDFVMDMLYKANVLLVHGSGFDEVYGKMHFRSVFLPTIETLSTAFDRIEKVMKEKES